LKLARCLRAHKNTFNKQKQYTQHENLKGKTGFGSRKANTKNTRNYWEIWTITYKSLLCAWYLLI
jgi:hypothetical protein